MTADRVNPTGELAAAIEKAVGTLRHTSDHYGSQMRFAIMELDRIFKSTQGAAEYESWFRKEAA